MHEILENIVEKSTFEKKEKFAAFLSKCLFVQLESVYSGSYHVLFKVQHFFDGISKVTNDYKKDQKLVLGVETLKLIFQELGIEVEGDDAFILFHLRNLGKFKIKDSKLKQELQPLWQVHKEYALNDSDFSHTIKVLRRLGLIEYRKGSLSIKANLDIYFTPEP